MGAKMTTETKITPVPELAIDKVLYPPDGLPHTRGRIERAIVWALLLHLEKEGFTAASVHDGEDDTPVISKLEAMELCFNLDDARIYFEKGDVESGSALLIFGNELDVISDWTLPEDGFDAAMDKFDAEKAVVMGVTWVVS